MTLATPMGTASTFQPPVVVGKLGKYNPFVKRILIFVEIVSRGEAESTTPAGRHRLILGLPPPPAAGDEHRSSVARPAEFDCQRPLLMINGRSFNFAGEARLPDADRAEQTALRRGRNIAVSVACDKQGHVGAVIIPLRLKSP